MKTFTDLKIGDIVYKVDIGYKASEGPQLEKIQVVHLGIEKDAFQVNKWHGYSNYTYLLNIPISQASKTDIIRTANEFITTNEDHVKQGLKEAGMKLIRSYENTISSYQDNIKKTRELYFEYLNYK